MPAATPPETLRDFARRYAPAATTDRGAELIPLAGDAGLRRYYRLTSAPPLILVAAPPKQAKMLEFVQVADYLHSAQVRVPHTYAVDFARGFLLLEDLGDLSLQAQLSKQDGPDQPNGQDAARLYAAALHLLERMQRGTRPDWLPAYSAALLQQELQLFPEWFAAKLLGITPDAATQRTLDAAFALLIKSALEQPQVFVHRDFHCRNLMVTGDGQLATIDFQDAVWGPLTYDLVSLCRDCYLRWPPQQVAETIQQQTARLREQGRLSAAQQADFPRWVDWMGLQRHLKVLGIFARLSLRDGKPQYLADLPLVLRYCLETAARYPPLAALHRFLAEGLVPAAQQQPWYRDWQSAGQTLDF